MKAQVGMGEVTQSLKPAAIALGIEINCGDIDLILSFTPQQPDFVVRLNDSLSMETNDMDDVTEVPVNLLVKASLSSYPIVQ